MKFVMYTPFIRNSEISYTKNKKEDLYYAV